MLASMAGQAVADDVWECEGRTADIGWDCLPDDDGASSPAANAGPTPSEADADPRAATTTAADTEPAAGSSATHGSELPDTTLLRTDLDRPGPLAAWQHCGPPTAPAAPASTDARSDIPLEIDANAVERVEASGRTLFIGDVIARRGDQTLKANRLTWDEASQTVYADGNIFYGEDGLQITSTKAELRINEDTGTLYDVDYYLVRDGGYGTATRVDIESSDISRFHDTSYTTCSPGNDDWVLYADELELDKATGVGQAWHPKLELGGVPVFYLPYMTFPIDDRRKSGFLIPTVATSSDNGLEITTPYYFNLAANRDATFTPRVIGKRGLMLGGQYRYLTHRYRGEANLEVLPDDQEDDRDRGSFSLDHVARLGDRWSTDVDFNYVSDNNYLNDFGNNLGATSVRNLQRRADLTYSRPYWTLRSRLQYFQNLETGIADTDEPYHRLPQFLLSANVPDSVLGLDYKMRAEAVYFQRHNTVTGGRIDLQPRATLPLEGSAYFVKPSLSLRHTFYQLDDPNDSDVDTETRTLPIVSLDSGLFLERDFNWRGNGFTQTLEPRLFYLYVPHDNQDDLPDFDTAEYTFSFAQLFRDNRFSGADRQSEANQLTTALTSRLINPASGVEHLRASIGSIAYFRNLEVNLPGDDTITDSSSDIVAEFAARPSTAWFLRGTLQWNPHDDETIRSVAILRYRPDNDHIANVAFRRRQDELEQVDFSGRWPLGDQLHAVGRWQYSLKEKEDLETMLGLEYNSCCWILRFVANRHIVDDNNDGDAENETIFALQLVLKGLTSVGESIDQALEENILGYHVED